MPRQTLLVCRLQLHYYKLNQFLYVRLYVHIQFFIFDCMQYVAWYWQQGLPGFGQNASCTVGDIVQQVGLSFFSDMWIIHVCYYSRESLRSHFSHDGMDFFVLFSANK